MNNENKEDEKEKKKTEILMKNEVKGKKKERN